MQLTETVPLTRRLVIGIHQTCDDALRAQLFTTFTSYGTMELIKFEPCANSYNTSVTVQFQRLSSAERLHSEACSSGRSWQAEYKPAALHLGCEILLSSCVPISANALQQLRDLASPSSSAAASSSALSCAAPASAVTVEEKSLHVPGMPIAHVLPQYAMSMNDSRMGSSGSAAMNVDEDRTAAAAVTREFVQSMALVQRYSIGCYVAVLSFASTHAANSFLVQQQHALAVGTSLYATHVGPADTSPLIPALKRLLTRTMLSDVCSKNNNSNNGCNSTSSNLMRGIVVQIVSNAECSVDVGLYASPTHPQSMLLPTDCSFLKVALGDEVLVQTICSNSAPYCTEKSKGVSAKLQRVLVEASRLATGLARNRHSKMTPNGLSALRGGAVAAQSSTSNAAARPVVRPLHGTRNHVNSDQTRQAHTASQPAQSHGYGSSRTASGAMRGACGVPDHAGVSATLHATPASAPAPAPASSSTLTYDGLSHVLAKLRANDAKNSPCDAQTPNAKTSSSSNSSSSNCVRNANEPVSVHRSNSSSSSAALSKPSGDASALSSAETVRGLASRLLQSIQSTREQDSRSAQLTASSSNSYSAGATTSTARRSSSHNHTCATHTARCDSGVPKHPGRVTRGGGGGGGAQTTYSARICAFPSGLCVYSPLTVQIDRIGSDGLHGHVVPSVASSSSSSRHHSRTALGHEQLGHNRMMDGCMNNVHGNVDSVGMLGSNGNDCAMHLDTNDRSYIANLLASSTSTRSVSASNTPSMPCVADAAAAASAAVVSWPVFIPSTHIPIESSTDDSASVAHWSEFAIAGERMRVVLLYATAVGDSTATMCLVASKLAHDMTRSVTCRHSRTTQHEHVDGADGQSNRAGGTAADHLSRGMNRGDAEADKRLVGVCLRVRVAYALSMCQMGVPECAFSDRSSKSSTRESCFAPHFPACVMQPTASVPAWSHEALLVMPWHVVAEMLPSSTSACPPSNPDAGQTHGMNATTRQPHVSLEMQAMELDVIVAEVVHDLERGRYLVTTSVSAYAAMQQRAVERERAAKVREVEDVRRRLAAVLGEDAVRGVAEEEKKNVMLPGPRAAAAAAAKRPRSE